MTEIEQLKEQLENVKLSNIALGKENKRLMAENANKSKNERKCQKLEDENRKLRAQLASYKVNK